MNAVGGLLLTIALCGAEPAAADGWGAGLSDRELAVSRWFAHLTFLQDRTRPTWPDWHDDGSQTGITSLRYQLAFAGYGCAAMAAKTPAYRALVARQLDDLCQRMIDRRVWHYVTHYWKYGDGPPDPCRYENVMYTGHLTQLMCLYELLSGDDRYSRSGWDFAWRDGRTTHYTLRAAIERMHVQSRTNACGGIACEPDLVFAACNSHSAASFVLCDALHGTHYAEANGKWFAWLSTRFRIARPDATAVFFLVYNQKHDFFSPLGDVGADCWTLGWGYPWFPTTDMAREAWRQIRARNAWRAPAPDMLYALNNAMLGCCANSKLSVSNAFVPLLAVQVEGRASPTGRKVLRWLEHEFGRAVDTDGDGHAECYYYHTDDALRIATTGTIAAALASDGDSLRRMFRQPRRELLTQPTVAQVDYPRVLVRTAEYRAPCLRFTVLPGVARFPGQTEIVCTNIAGPARVVRDGQPYSDCTQTGTRLVIRTDLEREHVFEVRVPAMPAQTPLPNATITPGDRP